MAELLQEPIAENPFGGQKLLSTGNAGAAHILAIQNAVLQTLENETEMLSLDELRNIHQDDGVEYGSDNLLRTQ